MDFYPERRWPPYHPLLIRTTEPHADTKGKRSLMDDRKNPPRSLNELLDRIEEVSVEQVMGAVGRRSFGPLLLVVGVVAAAPGVGDIPGVATLLGLFVLTVSVAEKENDRFYRHLSGFSLSSGKTFRRRRM